MATTTTQVGPYDQVYYDKTLIDRALPMLVHEVPAQKRSLGKKMGKTVNFREFESLPVATTALTEGVTPAASPYSVREVTAEVAQYGYVNSITDMVDATKPDAHMTEIVELQGEQAGLTKDTVIRNAIYAAGTNLFFQTAANTINQDGPAAEIIDEGGVDKVVRAMRNNNCPYFTEVVNGSTKVGTTPISPAYLCIVHPNQGYDVRGLTGFIPFEQYGSSMTPMRGEIGAYKQVRFLETTNAYNDGTNYYALFFGPNAFGVVALNGMDTTTYHAPFGSGEDTLHQRAKQGWKACWVAKILNDAFMAGLVTTVTA